MSRDSLAIALIGDHLVACPRDGIGLAPQLSGLLSGKAWGDVPVYDFTDAHGLRGIYAALPRQLNELAALHPDEDEHVVCVLTLGAADCRGGGPPPWAYVDAIAAMGRMIEAQGFRCVLVWAPPCPPGVGELAGFTRESRRWLTRTARRLEKRGLAHAIPIIPEDGWGDQLNLKRSGQEALLATFEAAVSRALS